MLRNRTLFASGHPRVRGSRKDAMAGEHVEIFLVSRVMQELVKDPFRAEGFRGEMDLLFRFVVRLKNTRFGIQLGYLLPELTSLAHLWMWFGQRTNPRTSSSNTLRLLRPPNLLRLELGSPSFSHNPQVSICRPGNVWQPNHRREI